MLYIGFYVFVFLPNPTLSEKQIYISQYDVIKKRWTLTPRV